MNGLYKSVREQDPEAYLSSIQTSESLIIKFKVQDKKLAAEVEATVMQHTYDVLRKRKDV